MTNGESVKDMTRKFDKLAKFEGQDFRRWQKKMHFLLTTLKVVYVLRTPSPVWSENETLETTRKRMKWENDDYICRGHILNGMSDSLFHIYQNAESAKALWESLESKYMAEDASAKKFLVSNFMNYKMVDTRHVMKQYHEMLRILGEYAQHNLMMDEAISVAVIVDKLPPSWKEFKHSLKHKKEELNLVQLGSHLRIEKGLRNQKLDNNSKGKNQIGSSSVNMVEGDGAKNSNNNKNKRKFKSGDDKFANKNGTVTCWKCKKTSHMKKDCRSRKGNDGAGSNGYKDPEKQQGYNSDFMQNFDNVLHYVSVISDAFYVQDDEVAWWVDSGATSHVCKDLRWFCKSIEDGSFVKMGNVATEPIKGIGRVLLAFTSGKTLCLDNVLYVPGIRKNLVSEIVNKCGYKQVLESDKYILSRHGSFVGFGYVCNGHVHYKRSRNMSKMSLIRAFDMTHESCKTCMSTKITRQPFKGVNGKSKVLDLIHSDLCDFHVNPSLGHNKYVIAFIDDASRYCYVYLLHAKHEALDKFKIYKQEVKLQRQDLIKVLRTDRGGEYYDPVYFQSTRIIHQTTAPYTPQQNGVAERKNRTLKEIVNSMLSYSGLSEGFWGEAMLTACYILNRTPNKNSKQTPYEIWTKKAPVARISTIRLLLALAAIHDLVIHQMDVKTAFLNGDLDEKIYMKQPEGFVMPRHESEACKLKKSLYDQVNKTKEFLSSKFDLKDLGEAELEYSRAIGCLMYAMISTRPDIAFAVGKLSRYTSNPSALHRQALEGYSDASWINNMKDHSSTSGWVFLLRGGAISWASNKQTCITSSTMESEFVALDAAGNEAEWLRNLIYEIPLWPKPISTISIRCDSAATLAKTYSQVYNASLDT
nr:zinc finger, CCHC-type [Tanacetum cinerariifolium]